MYVLHLTIRSLLLLQFTHVVTPASWLIYRLPPENVGPRLFCDNIPGLSSSQKKLCQQYPDMVAKFGSGLKLAVEECQHQFQKHRWNCSTFQSGRDTLLFANLLQSGNKEVAFIHSITSTAVAYSIANACRKGSLENCACEPDKTRGKSRDSVGEFDWSGCSNNVKFGLKFTRLFIDAKDSQTRDVRGLMNLHNNNLGRRAVTKHLELKCKCHGVSGSCSVRTCWKSMQEFAVMGDYLKSRYSRAIHVGMNQDGNGLQTLSQGYDSVKKGHMVYMEESSDYCAHNPATGSLGTAGRLCRTSKDAREEEACGTMCCGRGHQTSTVQDTINCDCKFQWCCFVDCEMCRVVKDENVCNG